MKMHRQLTAILFADIQGYTGLMQRNEAQASDLLRRFEKAIRQTVVKNNGRIANFYGDGALCLFIASLDAMRCAMELHATFQSEPILPVRIGLHSGTVTTEATTFYGDAINLASRIESMGIPGAILLSRKIRDDLKNQPDLEMVSIGQYEFKNVLEPIEVFALSNDGYLVPRRDQVDGKFQKQSPKTTSSIFRSKPMLAVSAVVMAVIALLLLMKTDLTVPEDSSNSIAILPFVDMSPDKDQEYFGDGIADEIITNLAPLSSLKVAGRTSSFAFKGKTSTITEIASALNVNYILEGSIRKQDSIVWVTAQLINAQNGFQAWSKKYTRRYDDIFRIQIEIADSIGITMVQKIVPDSTSSYGKSRHQNSEAYEFYLKAKHIHETRYASTHAIDDFLLSENLFQQAIAKDSSYALAHAGLADLYVTHVGAVKRDTTQFNKYCELAISESNIANALNPNLSFVLVIRGLVFRNIKQEVDSAYACFLASYKINPGFPDALLGLSWVYSDRGLDYDCIKLITSAIKIDPLRIWYFHQRSAIYINTGNYSAALDDANTLEQISPQNPRIQQIRFRSYVRSKQYDRAIDLIASLDKEQPGFVPDYIRAQTEALRGNDSLAISLSPNNFEVYYLLDDLDQFSTLWFKYWNAESTKPSFHSRSRYIQLSHDQRLKKLNDQERFHQILTEEKAKYNAFLSQYPRAETFLE